MKKQLPQTDVQNAVKNLVYFHQQMAQFLEDFSSNRPVFHPPWYRHVDWEKEVQKILKEHPEGLKPNELYHIIAEWHGCTYQEARTCTAEYLYYYHDHGLQKLRKGNTFIFKLA